MSEFEPRLNAPFIWNQHFNSVHILLSSSLKLHLELGSFISFSLKFHLYLSLLVACKFLHTFFLSKITLSPWLICDDGSNIPLNQAPLWISYCSVPLGYIASKACIIIPLPLTLTVSISIILQVKPFTSWRSISLNQGVKPLFGTINEPYYVNLIFSLFCRSVAFLYGSRFVA